MLILLDSLYDFFFSPASQEKVKGFSLKLAMVLLLLHIATYSVTTLTPFETPSRFTPHFFLEIINPPLTVILIYEVYLLVSASSKSILSFIAKQFEVVALIIVRGTFKDISKLSGTTDISFQTPLVQDVGLALAGSLVIYFVLEVFERATQEYATEELGREPKNLRMIKLRLAGIFGLIFSLLTIYHGMSWLTGGAISFETAYFRQIYSTLIVLDIVLLLLSMRTFKSFELLFEYSAFILASTLLFIALPLPLPLRLTLIISAIAFCVGVIRLHGFVRENNESTTEH